LSGCIGFDLVKAGKTVKVNGAISVTPQQDWNRLTDGDHEIWTLDGPILQKITFIMGISDDGYLFNIKKPGSYKVADGIPRFDEKMNALEAIDLFEATLARLNAQQLSVSKAKPYKFGNKTGFRFDFSYQSSSGLQRLGMTAGLIKDKKLYLVIYSGTRLYYFDRGRRDFENILQSIRFL